MASLCKSDEEFVTPEKRPVASTFPWSGSTTAGDSVRSTGACSAVTTRVVDPRVLDFENENTLEGIDLEHSAKVEEQSLASTLLPECTADNGSASQGSGSERVYWEGFFIVLPMFAGYASLFGLQHELKKVFAIADDASSASHSFSFAVSFQFIFNMIFRPGHNVFFGFLSARHRVFAAMCSMMSALLVLSVVIIFLEQHHIGFVILAYSFGGVAIGTFECNFLSCITPLGHATKHVCITAIPVGVGSVLIGAFFVMGPPFHVPVAFIYLFVACMLACGMVVMATRIPSVDIHGANGGGGAVTRQASARTFASDLGQWRKWLPSFWHYPLAGTIDMFTLSCFSPGVLLYVYNTKTVSILPDVDLPVDYFFVIFNFFNMMGGLLGRFFSYRVKPRHPICYVIINVFGVCLVLLKKFPILAPLGTFLVMMGDGFIYGALVKHIDMHTPKEFNLTALSFKFVLSDIGSIIGSNSISYVRDWVGSY